jgi:large subunit ribosomal protein L14
MIYIGSFLNIKDNSGVKEVQSIRIFGRSKKRPGKVGDLILVSTKSCSAKQKFSIKTGKLYQALIVHVKKNTKRKDGTVHSSGNNVAVLLNTNGTPICTRFFGPLSYEIRSKGFVKLISTAKYLY